jgi:phage-related protein
MSESLGKAVLELGADHLKLDRDMADAEKKVGSSAKGMGGKFKSGLQAGMVPAVAVLATAGAAAKKTIDAASDLGEQISKTGVVFGNSAKDIHAWSKTTASSLGISQRAALEAAGTFGNMLVPMGFAQKDAAAMSKKMVTLAADMASFNNASPEETLDALRAGLSGETEPLRKFGVFLNEARVKAEAMSLGIVKASKDTDKIKSAQLRAEVAQRNYTAAVAEHGKGSDQAKAAKAGLISAEGVLEKAMKGNIGNLTAAQKAQATYALIMKDSKAAQGDFARTATSAANASRIQAAKTEDLSAKIGQGLLPTYQQLQQIVLKVTDFMGKHTEATKVAVGVIVGLAAAVVAVNVGMKLYAAGAAVVTAAQWAWNTAVSANPIGLVVIAIAALVAALVVAWKNSETFRRIVTGAWNGIRDTTTAVWGALKSFFDKWWPALLAVATFGLSAIVLTVIGHWDDIKGATVAAWDAIKTAVTSPVTAIRSAVSVGWGAIQSVTSTTWGAVKSASSTSWNATKSVVETAVGGIKSGVTTGWNAVKSATSAAWSAVKTATSGGAGGALDVVQALPGKIYTALSNLSDRLNGIAKAAFNQFKSGITTAATSAVEYVEGLPGKIKGAIGNLGSLLVGAGRAIIQGLIQGIEQMLGALWGKVSGIAKKIKSLKGPIEKDRVLLVDEGKAIIQGLGHGIDREFEGLKKDISAYAPTIQSTFAQGAGERFTAGPPSSTIDKMVNIEHMEVRDAFDEDKLAADLAWKVVSG